MSDQKRPRPAATTHSTSGPFGGGGPARGGFGLVEKPKNFKGTLQNLLQYLKPYWISITVVLVLAVASNIFSIVGPKVLGNITNHVVADYVKIKAYDQMTASLHKNLDLSKRPSIDFGSIAHLVELLLALYLVSALFGYLQGWIMSGISQQATYKFRQDISSKINRLPLRYFDTRTYGEVLSRITNDVDTVSQTLNQSLTQIVSAITSIVGILIMMLWISWQMTLVALLIVPLSFVVVGLIISRSQRYFKAQQVTLGSINGHIEEMYGGHVVMRVFNGADQSVKKFKVISAQLYDSAWKSQFLSGLMFPIMSFLGNLGYVGVSVLGGYLAVKGKLQIGDIQAFIQYTNSFNQPILQTANVANVMQSTAAAAERVFEFLAEEEERPDPAQPVALPAVQGRVEFDNVVFGYESGKTIIKGFTASIQPGQRIAIVGPTGAGKTTIVNLLMRFYDLNSGSIRIDGVDIQSLDRSTVRRLFGMVLQDTWLFNGTIKENLAYGKPAASMKEIESVASAAHAEHFIHALPSGYNMVLNEEAANLSQGEKQLLTIARAMLANPPMLILDEATSSVDTRTEVLIQRAMEKLMEGRTSFVIAHRLSTIRNADLILVMRDGSIVEQGTHIQLMAQRGYYASLYNSQFSLSVE
jgi:ATP-binding cassette subfamily B protein